MPRRMQLSRYPEFRPSRARYCRCLRAQGECSIVFRFRPMDFDEIKGSPRPPRSLYHKERPPLRSRADPRHKQPAPIPPTPSTQRGTPPGKQYLLRSLRTFGIFLIAMVGLLFLSIMALRGIWAMKDREIKRDARPTAITQDSVTAAVAASTSLTGTALSVQQMPELDTERIRRAVFLSKHAQALEAGGSTTEAIARYREALEVWPYLNDVWAKLGRAYLKTREYNKAQLALEKAVQGSPGTASLMNDLGAALLYQGQIARAMDLFEAAAEIDPSFAPTQFNLALCQLSRNDRPAARASLQVYLRIKPNDARALRELAFLDALEAHYDDALRSLQQALTESPDWPLLYFDAAAVAALMGRMDQAISYLEKAEPLSSPRAVYQIYKEPAFREIRLTELGKEFEHDLAARARERMNEEIPAAELHPPSEPLLSSKTAEPKK